MLRDLSALEQWRRRQLEGQGLVRTGHRMLLLTRVWHKLQIDLLRQICIPMARDLGIAEQAKEDDCDPRSHAPDRDSVTLPQTSRHGHGQRILRRTNRHAFQTPGALSRANLDELRSEEHTSELQ